MMGKGQQFNIAFGFGSSEAAILTHWSLVDWNEILGTGK